MIITEKMKHLLVLKFKIQLRDYKLRLRVNKLRLRVNKLRLRVNKMRCHDAWTKAKTTACIHAVAYDLGMQVSALIICV